MINQEIVCDKCGGVIEDSPVNSDMFYGVSVWGNIHVADSTADKGIGGGLVGNNFTSELDEDGNNIVNVSHYHINCLFDIVSNV